MGKLKQEAIEEYFDIHLPYRTRILLAHYKMRHTAKGDFVRWAGKQSWLDACFVASLVTARLYLNMLGIAKKGNSLVNFGDKGDDVTVDDLGGTRLSISTISQPDQKMLLNFIIMADKAAAHFTTPMSHDRTTIPRVILMIRGYIKTHLYDAAGRTGLETVEEGCAGEPPAEGQMVPWE